MPNALSRAFLPVSACPLSFPDSSPCWLFCFTNHCSPYLSRQIQERMRKFFTMLHSFYSFWVVLCISYIFTILSEASYRGWEMSPIFSGLMQFAFRVSSAFIITYLVGPVGIFAAEPFAWTGSVIYLSLRLIYRIRHNQITS